MRREGNRALFIRHVSRVKGNLYSSGIEPFDQKEFPLGHAHAMLARGLIAVASMKNQNAARLLMMQSIASPAAGLAGAWAG
jgi:hypothetical protein